MVDSLTPSIRIFESTDRSFETNGLGALNEATKCTVTEERNGAFELEMEYPINGDKFKEITVDRILVAKPNPYRNSQAFRIYDIVRNNDGTIVVKAEHISYDTVDFITGGQILYDSDGQYNNPQALWRLFTDSNHLIGDNFPFIFESDVGPADEWLGFEQNDIFYTVKSLLTNDSEDSILSLFDGEFDYDNYTIKFLRSRGTDNGVIIGYGKNLLDIEQKENTVNEYTGVMPYWSDKYEDNITIKKLNPPVIWKGSPQRKKIFPLDTSDIYDEEPTDDQLRSAGNAWLENPDNVTTDISVTIEFVDLSDSSEYSNLKNLEKVELCDTITVKHYILGVETKTKITRTVYNVLTNSYDSISLGDIKNRFIDVLSSLK